MIINDLYISVYNVLPFCRPAALYRERFNMIINDLYISVYNLLPFCRPAVVYKESYGIIIKECYMAVIYIHLPFCRPAVVYNEKFHSFSIISFNNLKIDSAYHFSKEIYPISFEKYQTDCFKVACSQNTSK